MVRTSVRYLILYVFTMGLVAQAYAATPITVRGGEHKTYSRLVFDFKNKIEYSSQRVAGGYRITFQGDYYIDTTSLHVALLSHVNEFREEKTKPLTVLIKTPAQTGLSSFLLGTRIVFDFKEDRSLPVEAVDVPGDMPEHAEKTEPQPKDDILPSVETVKASPPSQQGLSGVEQTQGLAKGNKHLSPKTAAHEASSRVEEGDTQKTAIQEKATHLGQVIENKIKLHSAYPNFVMVSSVQPTAMSAFILNDRLWFVNSARSSLISPQVVGSDKKLIGRPELVPNDEAHVFRLKALPGVDYMAQGSALAWRLLIGHDFAPEHKPQQLQRQDVDTVAARRGQIFIAMPESHSVVGLEDPSSGYPLYSVTVDGVHSYTGDAYDFVDFKILPSPLGMTVMSYVDDLVVDVVEGGVLIYRSGGHDLVLSSQVNVDNAVRVKPTKKKVNI